jgi:hypothetical protein
MNNLQHDVFKSMSSLLCLIGVPISYGGYGHSLGAVRNQLEPDAELPLPECAANIP